MFPGVFGVPLKTSAGVVVWYVNAPRLAGGFEGGAGAQLTAVATPALMIAANAVAAGPPARTERLNGSTAATIVETSTLARPILLAFASVNHSAPSGPAVMPLGPLLAVGIGNSVMPPAVVIRPILPLKYSVNHKAPSGPVAMEAGEL